ncbi:prolyl oligopeptidase family serine peptidase [uncultured Roseobacter sp.]|uniref:alpha/beta hydrolase family protein n=1 Tax=uncultured Roseobacter sp. TaxID=114847 RepID=UPI00261905D8|nr:prolyl oligopeptidase family serine peptidase [uncultured Roseobacter sp.]
MRYICHALVLSVLATVTANADDVGVIERRLSVQHHETGLETTVLFPGIGGQAGTLGGNAVFFGTPVLKDARPLPGRYPVVVMSHGWGGNAARMAWLGAALAEKGAIVVAVNHPGSTTFDVNFDTAFHHWTRAQDLSAALDWLLQDPEFAPFVDHGRIYAAGFSYGGWTALSLAGVRGSRAGFFQYCEAAGAGSQFCAMLERAGVDIRAIDETRYEGSYRDPRVQAVAAIDPGLTWGLAKEDLSEASAKMLLIALGEGADRLRATDTGPSGSGFEALVPEAVAITIAPATHFSVLGLCTPRGAAILVEEQDDPVCTDPPGTDRAQVLQQIIEAIADHFGL